MFVQSYKSTKLALKTFLVRPWKTNGISTKHEEKDKESTGKNSLSKRGCFWKNSMYKWFSHSVTAACFTRLGFLRLSDSLNLPFERDRKREREREEGKLAEISTGDARCDKWRTDGRKERWRRLWSLYRGIWSWLTSLVRLYLRIAPRIAGGKRAAVSSSFESHRNRPP